MLDKISLYSEVDFINIPRITDVILMSYTMGFMQFLFGVLAEISSQKGKMGTCIIYK